MVRDAQSACSALGGRADLSHTVEASVFVALYQVVFF